MKFEIGQIGEKCSVMTDDDKKIHGVTAITIHAKAGMPTKVDVELTFIETTAFECKVKEFAVGPYSNVVGLILSDGSEVDLTEEYNGPA